MAASLLVAFMAFTSCDKPTTPDPVFTSTTEGDIAVPAGGVILKSLTAWKTLLKTATYVLPRNNPTGLPTSTLKHPEKSHSK